ncbi:hypothetical protein OESDEN_18698 [Oesophagostomum dentatum]|uniref:DUF4440 domain-containing protein n=1 Tax=Oesophagostomum dentatum TaxID=61180 RepID=A0A0B1S9M8_OESDE|nr:hypothetical protein OESDEN_18698 [Oesophagostomum dentatum]
MEKTYYDGHMEKAITDYFHPEGVVVHKGVGAQYAVLEGFGKMAEEFGKVKFARHNETFHGSECCLCTAYDVDVDSEKKGKVKAKVFQIWKKDGAKWKIYHDEFENPYKVM